MLIRQAMQGDKEAFSMLVLPLENKLYRLARSVLRSPEDCADALQNALVRAWQGLPSLRKPELFEAWLVRILLNECRRTYRKKAAERHAVQAAELHDDPDMGSDATLRLALDSLGESQRILITLHHLLGYSIEEIASIQKIPQGTVKSRLARARKALAVQLEG